jgi:predicted restriction endonuclease
MSALHDRAFDRGLISFDEGRKLLVSDRLKNGEPNKVIRVSILDLEGKELEGAERYAPDPLAWPITGRESLRRQVGHEQH